MDDLMKIPGVGKSIEKHLREIGICCSADLIGKDPEKLKWWYWKDKGYPEREDKEGYV